MSERLLRGGGRGRRRGDRGRRSLTAPTSTPAMPTGRTAAAGRRPSPAATDGRSRALLDAERRCRPPGRPVGTTRSCTPGAEGLLDILRLANEAGADPAHHQPLRWRGARSRRQRAWPRRGRPLPARPSPMSTSTTSTGSAGRPCSRPSSWATAGRPSRTVVDLLIEHGADVDLADKDGVQAAGPCPRPRTMTAIARLRWRPRRDALIGPSVSR